MKSEERVKWDRPQELYRAALAARYPHEKMQVEKRQTMFTYDSGPMYYLGQQIVKAMEDAGYPAKILYCFRSPEEQAELYAKGRTAPGNIITNAPPWTSAHQYYEAVDIIHPSLGWGVSEEYWETLASCVRIVAGKFGVALEHGHYWRFRDSAHIQIRDWHVMQARHRRTVLQKGEARPPNEAELWARFKELIPEVADRYERTTTSLPGSADRAEAAALALLDRIFPKDAWIWRFFR